MARKRYCVRVFWPGGRPGGFRLTAWLAIDGARLELSRARQRAGDKDTKIGLWRKGGWADE